MPDFQGSRKSYLDRALEHPHPVAKRLFQVAELKKSNLQELGPYIAVFKTHIDLVADFSDDTVSDLKRLAQKHNYLIFEDRKLVDIGHTVQRQYHGGALRLSEWADLVNLSILSGDSIVEALDQTITAPDFPYEGQRALLLLAEMTTSGSRATGAYTEQYAALAPSYPNSVIGFVASRALTTPDSTTGAGDFVSAIARGADFVIAGRGIYAAADPVAAAITYRNAGWEAYMRRTRQRGESES
ncbi:orotidine 5'-phosphate decarboxylase [Apiospora saccharicola]